MRTRQKQKIIIGTLCAVIIGLAVGYAVLSQQLTINGTGGIASDFNVLFTNITEGIMNGATTVNKQITDSTTATFTIDLKSPGSNGEYLITVENRGTIDAMVESISGLDEANQAAPTDITFSISDIAVNDKLPAKESKVFKVKVDWSSASTSIPSTNKNLTLKINFVQDASSTPTPEPAAEYLINNKLSSDINISPTNGLFAIDNQGELTTSASPREYRYIGADPDNYIQFNNELWRIIGIFNGQLKIIRNDSIENSDWDNNGKLGSNNWSKASLQTYLNNDYYRTIDPEDQTKIDNDYVWKLGGSSTYDDVTAQMLYERERGTEVYEGNSTEWTGSIALMYPSDYGFATSGGNTMNRSSCLTTVLNKWSNSYIYTNDCHTNSWLYDSTDTQWTLTPVSYDSMSVIIIYSSLNEGNVFVSEAHNLDFDYGVRPTLYLIPDVEIASGTGGQSDPYILK